MITSEESACLEAYQRELDYILRTLERLGVNRSDVEDLAQDIFLILRNTWSTYDPSRPLKPYLFGIAFRVASSYKRRRWRELPREFIESPDQTLSPADNMEAEQIRAMVLAGLQEIPLPRRAVLLMHDIDLVPVQDIAKTLGIPLFTVYSRLRKARIELGQAVSKMQTPKNQIHNS